MCTEFGPRASRARAWRRPGGKPDLIAESTTAKAESNGSRRRQSTRVRSRLVTASMMSSGPRLARRMIGPALLIRGQLAASRNGDLGEDRGLLDCPLMLEGSAQMGQRAVDSNGGSQSSIGASRSVGSAAQGHQLPGAHGPFDVGPGGGCHEVLAAGDTAEHRECVEYGKGHRATIAEVEDGCRELSTGGPQTVRTGREPRRTRPGDQCPGSGSPATPAG